VPRARDVRLRLTPRCADKPNYFRTQSVGGLAKISLGFGILFGICKPVGLRLFGALGHSLAGA